MKAASPLLAALSSTTTGGLQHAAARADRDRASDPLAAARGDSPFSRLLERSRDTLPGIAPGNARPDLRPPEAAGAREPARSPEDRSGDRPDGSRDAGGRGPLDRALDARQTQRRADEARVRDQQQRDRQGQSEAAESAASGRREAEAAATARTAAAKSDRSGGTPSSGPNGTAADRKTAASKGRGEPSDRSESADAAGPADRGALTAGSSDPVDPPDTRPSTATDNPAPGAAAVVPLADAAAGTALPQGMGPAVNPSASAAANSREEASPAGSGSTAGLTTSGPRDGQPAASVPIDSGTGPGAATPDAARRLAMEPGAAVAGPESGQQRSTGPADAAGRGRPTGLTGAGAGAGVGTGIGATAAADASPGALHDAAAHTARAGGAALAPSSTAADTASATPSAGERFDTLLAAAQSAGAATAGGPTGLGGTPAAVLAPGATFAASGDTAPAGPVVQAQVADALDSPGFAPSLAHQVSVLTRDGIERAEIRLNPVDLGPVSVQIQLDGTVARVEFTAEQAPTRSALEASLPQLAAALREAGFTLGGGGVFQQGNGRSSGDGSSRSGERSASRANRADDARLGPLEAAPAARRLSQGAVDLYA